MKTFSYLMMILAALFLGFNLKLAAQDEENPQDQQDEKKANGIKSYSKYDFIPGEKVMFFDDFSQEAVGDFPARWNTNGSGEVVTIDGYEGKWFKMSPDGIFLPEAMNNFPENFTIEFDLLYQRTDEGSDTDFPIELVSMIEGEEMDAAVPGNGGAGFILRANLVTAYNWLNKEWGDINSDRETDIINTSANSSIVKISIWGQKQRLRLYMNETKVFDIPKLLPSGFPVNCMRYTTAGHVEENQFYITNLRMASGKPDMRNKLLTEGKLVTYGIYFDSGSDKVKPESYGTLKGIADILTSEATLRVMIVGHTDSDGDENKNLDLSKRRAAAVKNSLVSDFGIDASRLETDGKGESEPVSPNTTAEGKASNRRVELIKL